MAARFLHAFLSRIFFYRVFSTVIRYHLAALSVDMFTSHNTYRLRIRNIFGVFQSVCCFLRAIRVSGGGLLWQPSYLRTLPRRLAFVPARIPSITLLLLHVSRSNSTVHWSKASRCLSALSLLPPLRRPGGGSIKAGVSSCVAKPASPPDYQYVIVISTTIEIAIAVTSQRNGNKKRRRAENDAELLPV